MKSKTGLLLKGSWTATFLCTPNLKGLDSYKTETEIEDIVNDSSEFFDRTELIIIRDCGEHVKLIIISRK